MVMRSFENRICDSITMVEITASLWIIKNFGYSFEMFWPIELNAGEITTIITN